MRSWRGEVWRSRLLYRSLQPKAMQTGPQDSEVPSWEVKGLGQVLTCHPAQLWGHSSVSEVEDWGSGGAGPAAGRCLSPHDSGVQPAHRGPLDLAAQRSASVNSATQGHVTPGTAAAPARQATRGSSARMSASWVSLGLGANTHASALWAWPVTPSVEHVGSSVLLGYWGRTVS